MSYNDEQLRAAIDDFFKKYDTDGSQSLDANEIANFINDVLASIQPNRKATEAEIQQVIAAIDKSGDGKIQKPELFEILKQCL